MPRIRVVRSAQEVRRAAPTAKLDLTEQLDLLQEAVASGEEHPWVELDLTEEEGKDLRRTKRRMTEAAKAMDYTLTWRTPREGGDLAFVLSRPGHAIPGARRGRPRKARQQQTEEAAAVDASPA